MYYNQLIKRGKLIKYWIFFGGEFKSSFKINYNYFSVIYLTNVYFNFNKLIFSIKNVLPFLLNISCVKGKIIFVATKWLYSKIIYHPFYLSLIKDLVYRNPGIFSNISYLKDLFFNKLDFNTIPTVLIFFYFKDKDYLLREAKKKKIPVIGLIGSKTKVTLIDYPIFINTDYFYVSYFFSKFLFKFIFLAKYKR